MAHREPPASRWGSPAGELADRAVLQVNKFGARLSIRPGHQPGIRRPLSDPQSRRRQTSRQVLLIATGAQYGGSKVENCQKSRARCR